MNATSWSWLLALTSAASMAAPLDARAETPPKAYLVTTIGQSAAGNSVVHEVLSVQDAGDASRIAVAGADGSLLSLPVRFTSQGEIASNSQAGSVTCYNMAMGVLARMHEPATSAPSIFLRFGTSVVEVPLVVNATQAQGAIRTTALTGTSTGVFHSGDDAMNAGILINASVEQNGDDLRGATFDEIHYLGTPEHVVSRSSCSIMRAIKKPPVARV